MKVHIPVSITAPGKCVYDKCFHDNSKHYHGLCWEETQPEEKGLAKFCPCTFQGETHRLFKDLGHMIPSTYDAMITKKCITCNKDFMMNLDESFCSSCKSKMTTLK